MLNSTHQMTRPRLEGAVCTKSELPVLESSSISRAKLLPEQGEWELTTAGQNGYFWYFSQTSIPTSNDRGSRVQKEKKAESDRP